MKKLFLLCGLSLLALMAKAGDFSLKVDNITLEPGGYGYVTITSTGDLSDYCAFQLDFICPEGLFIPSFELDGEKYFGVYDEDADEFYDAFVINGTDDGIYYYDRMKKEYRHQMETNVLEGGQRGRVVVYSGQNKKFNPKKTLELQILVQATENAKGTYAVTVENPKFATDGSSSEVASGFCPEVEAGTVTVGTSETTITYELKAKYGTLILPFAAELPSGLTAYTCSELDGNELKLDEAETLAANTPYIMGGTSGTYTFTGTPVNDENSYTVGLLTGVLVETKAPADSYVLQKNSDVLGFYKVTAGKNPSVKAYRCYLNAKASSALVIRFGGTTEISDIQFEENDAMYDILGRKVEGTLQKGFYIVNGKKVFVK